MVNELHRLIVRLSLRLVISTNIGIIGNQITIPVEIGLDTITKMADVICFNRV